MKTKLFFCFLLFAFGLFTVCFNVWREEYFAAIGGLAMMFFSIIWGERFKT